MTPRPNSTITFTILSVHSDTVTAKAKLIPALSGETDKNDFEDCEIELIH